jgi:hypothetical protein
MAGLLDLPLGRNAPGGALGDITGLPPAGGILGNIGQGPVPAFAPPLHPLGQMMPHAGFVGGAQGNGIANPLPRLGPEDIGRLALLVAAHHAGVARNSAKRVGTHANPHRPRTRAHYEQLPSGAYYLHPSGILKIKTTK